MIQEIHKYCIGCHQKLDPVSMKSFGPIVGWVCRNNWCSLESLHQEGLQNPQVDVPSKLED